jgi:hypothetical protein
MIALAAIVSMNILVNEAAGATRQFSIHDTPTALDVLNRLAELQETAEAEQHRLFELHEQTLAGQQHAQQEEEIQQSHDAAGIIALPDTEFNDWATRIMDQTAAMYDELVHAAWRMDENAIRSAVGTRRLDPEILKDAVRVISRRGYSPDNSPYLWLYEIALGLEHRQTAAGSPQRVYTTNLLLQAYRTVTSLTPLQICAIPPYTDIAAAVAQTCLSYTTPYRYIQKWSAAITLPPLQECIQPHEAETAPTTADKTGLTALADCQTVHYLIRAIRWSIGSCLSYAAALTWQNPRAYQDLGPIMTLEAQMAEYDVYFGNLPPQVAARQPT